MNKFLLIFILFNSICLADTPIKVLSEKYSKTARINIKILKENQMIVKEECKLVITCRDLKDEIKTYTQSVQTGDYIRIPEGDWDFEVFYKYGFSTFIATYRIKSKKNYDIDINFESWLDIYKTGMIVGKIFDKKRSSIDYSQKKAEDFELARLNFYGLPVIGSFAPIEKCFMVNWLIDKPYGGRVWYCSRLPFLIDANNNTFYHHQVLSKMDQNKTMSFYYQPSENKTHHSLFMQSFLIPEIQKFYDKKPKYCPYLATSLVFDTIAGPLYTGLDVDITNDKDLKIWYCLLNMGYQIPIVSSNYSTASGFENTWMFLPKADSDTIEDKFKLIKNGASTLSNGPALLFKIDSTFAGGALLADNSNHQLTIQARVDPGTWDIVESFEIIRNGSVYKKVKPESVNHIFQVNFYHVFEKSYAWYVVRINTKLGKTAITNPIYFLPEGYLPPSPASSLLKVFLKDEDDKELSDANVKIISGNKIIYEGIIEKSTFEFQVPITAEIIIQKEGYLDDHFYISDHKNVMQLMMDLSIDDVNGSARLADPSIYKKLREDLMFLIQRRVLKRVKEDKIIEEK